MHQSPGYQSLGSALLQLRSAEHEDSFIAVEQIAVVRFFANVPRQVNLDGKRKLMSSC